MLTLMDAERDTHAYAYVQYIVVSGRGLPSSSDARRQQADGNIQCFDACVVANIWIHPCTQARADTTTRNEWIAKGEMPLVFNDTARDGRHVRKHDTLYVKPTLAAGSHVYAPKWCDMLAVENASSGWLPSRLSERSEDLHGHFCYLCKPKGTRAWLAGLLSW